MRGRGKQDTMNSTVTASKSSSPMPSPIIDPFGRSVSHAGVACFQQIEAGAEHGAGATEDKDALGPIRVGGSEGCAQLLEQRDVECISLFRPVQERRRDGALASGHDE